jgi:hypothetical protein
MFFKIQFVPSSKHTVSRLHKHQLMLYGESLLILRSIENT